MNTSKTFFEFTDKTKSKWETLAEKAAAYASLVKGGGDDHQWTKDEIIGHIEALFRMDEEEIDEKMLDTYFKRMRDASVYNGTSKPTLDLIYTDNGMAYVWLRNNELPCGLLSHILGIGNAFPKIAFNYFLMMSKEYSIDDLVEAIGADKAMTMLLFAELFARVHKAGEFSPDQFEFYIQQINELKADIQTRITKEQAEQFNAMMGALLLTAGD
jgi:hypothetical protein